jgi:hypothetical protein
LAFNSRFTLSNLLIVAQLPTINANQTLG